MWCNHGFAGRASSRWSNQMCHKWTKVAYLVLLWHTRPVMADHKSIEVTVGPQVRLVVPATLRRRLGIEPGDVLIASAQQDRLVLERRDAILSRVRQRLAVVP